LALALVLALEQVLVLVLAQVLALVLALVLEQVLVLALVLALVLEQEVLALAQMVVAVTRDHPNYKCRFLPMQASLAFCNYTAARFHPCTTE
jgi:hypothetical protein